MMRSMMPRNKVGGFTLAEVVVAIALLGIGLSATVGALTKINAFANNARNATGAYAAVMTQIDQFQSLSPFNPQKNETPKDAGAFPKYDLSVGTHQISTNGTDFNVPVYQYNDAVTGKIIVVKGALTTTVTDNSTTYGASKIPISRYRATATLKYTYLNRNYTLSMDTVRASDE